RLGERRDRTHRRHRAGHARRLHLRAGTDRRLRGTVRHSAAPHLRRRWRAGGVTASVPLDPPKRLIELAIDGESRRVPEGATILQACLSAGVEIPTLCYLETLSPVNVCRVCVVEVEGSRVLVPACSRKVEPEMKVLTDSERVRHSRRLVLELLASSVDMALCAQQVHGWMARYGAKPERFGAAATV